MTVYCFDIDGTICTNTNGDYEQAKPIEKIIEKINNLYKEGHTIIIFTARGATTGIDWKETTEYQLHSWGVCYHELLMGKPHADVFVDDKAITPEEIIKEYKLTDH